ncbi:hypothetical protein PMAYCL1PPCAC_08599, partial [Pristionchus mayeri]
TIEMYRVFILSPLFLSSLGNTLHDAQGSLSQVGREWNDTLMEGSGEGSGQYSWTNDNESSTLAPEEITPNSQLDISSTHSRSEEAIEKRPTDRNHKLGSLPMQFLGKMDFRSPSSIPSSALMALGRPLKKGLGRSRAEYVTLAVQSSSRRWGSLFLDSKLTPQAHFIDNTRLLDARVSSVPFRVLLLPPSTYNVEVEWVPASLVDPLSIIVQVDTRKPYAKITAGVLVYPEYEYLGEADVEHRRFTYYDGSHVIIVQGEEFDKNVHVLTKSVCTCPCHSRR